MVVLPDQSIGRTSIQGHQYPKVAMYQLAALGATMTWPISSTTGIDAICLHKSQGGRTEGLDWLPSLDFELN